MYKELNKARVITHIKNASCTLLLKIKDAVLN